MFCQTDDTRRAALHDGRQHFACHTERSGADAAADGFFTVIVFKRLSDILKNAKNKN